MILNDTRTGEKDGQLMKIIQIYSKGELILL